MGVSRLYDLQQVDLGMARLTARLAELDDGSLAREAVGRSTDTLQVTRQQLASCRARLRALELESESLAARRAKMEADLYSGRVRNPKELEAMHEDVAALDRQRGRVEDEMLALLLDIERLEPEERAAAAALEAAEATLAHRLATTEQELASANRELTNLAARRAAILEGLDETLLRRYERLREHKGGLAVVAARDGVCEGCHITIPDRLLRRAQDDPDALVACDGCGRLLHVVPP